MKELKPFALSSAGVNTAGSNKLLNRALLLAVITICYNIIEGLVSVIFGFTDETISLFGFGLDSFVEVVSGIGILHMIIRIKNNGSTKDSFEKNALIITGTSFYILAIGLAITSIYNIYVGSKPVSTLWGIIISAVSILSMLFLMKAKMDVGRKLNSDAIIADANCTKTCLYLSVILLISSLLFEIFKIGYVDSIGAIGLAYYSYKEGKEAIEKSKGNTCSCCN
ncbi:MAG: cation transporter [Proteobacteria bacterium]|nr:cation transporter [Pseudomonadota bacterium]